MKNYKNLTDKSKTFISNNKVDDTTGRDDDKIPYHNRN